MSRMSVFDTAYSDRLWIVQLRKLRNPSLQVPAGETGVMYEDLYVRRSHLLCFNLVGRWFRATFGTGGEPVQQL